LKKAEKSKNTHIRCEGKRDRARGRMPDGGRQKGMATVEAEAMATLAE